MNKIKKKTFTLNLPCEELKALQDQAHSLGISITLLIRLWIRAEIMGEPIASGKFEKL